MENSLSKYQNQELKGIINSVQVVSGTARETGNVYYAIEIRFINGYTKRIFLKNDEMFAWTNAMDSLNTEHAIDNSF